MPWENLEEDLAEELGQVGLDNASLFKDGLRWSCPTKDVEATRNYDHWYHKQVYYPKNKEKVLAKQKHRYHTVVKKDPVLYEKRRESWRKYNHKEKCPDGYARKLERNRGYYYKNIMADPVKHAAHLERRRQYYARAKEKKLGQETTSSTRE